MNADDERLGRLLRLIRRENHQTQEMLADAARVPVRDIMRIEDGHAGDVRVDRVRRLFAAAGGHARISTWWHGAAADRLLDERHAMIVEGCVAIFRRRGWRPQVEVTFSDYGERGSIDILAGYESTKTVAVCEVKSVVGSLEETNRKLDIKERLAPKIALARFGWRPLNLGRLLILPDDTSARRVVSQHATTMDAIYPARGREIRRWLRLPSGTLRGIWFLSELPIPQWPKC